jgi:hypothetical protein
VLCVSRFKDVGINHLHAHYYNLHFLNLSGELTTWNHKTRRRRGRKINVEIIMSVFQVYSQQIALIEQEICTRSTVFLGSGQSTWSLAVFRLRLARRRAKQILESRQQLDSSSSSRGGAEEKQIQEVLIKQIEGDEAVIEELMRDKHAAGLACRFPRYFNRIRFNATVETYVDEAPDGWLDLEACEGRIGRGGKCEVAKCF